MTARRTLAALLAGSVVAAGLLLGAAGPASAAPEAGSTTPTSTKYPGDAKAEAAMAAAEDRRITEVRTIANAQYWADAATAKAPYQVSMTSGYTLVLVARAATYTVKDLASLAPRYFSKENDGSWLLSENVVVDQGATLDLSGDKNMRLHLLSTPDSFVSIVTIGGSLILSGTHAARAHVTSWDPNTGKADTDTTNGRAYVRVVGGHAELSDATFADLGFWSGMTGGVSLTGTDKGDVNSTTQVANGSTKIHGTAKTPPAAGSSSLHGNVITPATGGTETGGLGSTTSGYVSALVQNVDFSGNAFGLYVTSADGVSVRDSSAEDNLVDGFVFHRNVTNSEIVRTSSRGNRLDGFALDRATSGITLTRLDARHNGRNGVTMNGRALASGPSATGLDTGEYGNNSLSASTAKDNGRYGIEVIGGSNVDVDGNTVSNNLVGIVVNTGASSIAVTNNDIDTSGQQAISIRDAGRHNTITKNSIAGGDIGIYVRNSGVAVTRNTIDDSRVHAVTLVGSTGASTVERNVVSGRGPSAIDVARTTNTTVKANDTGRWHSTKPLLTVIRNFLQPLTVMWLLLGLILVITAFTGVRRHRRNMNHPYENLAPLSSFTRGEVSRDQLPARTVRQGTLA